MHRSELDFIWIDQADDYQFCQHCGQAVFFKLDPNCKHLEMICPYCEQPMMLCSACPLKRCTNIPGKGCTMTQKFVEGSKRKRVRK